MAAKGKHLDFAPGKPGAPPTVSFVGQKGGVGKSTLARLFAVGAAHRGLNPLLADFDLEQLTCVEWNALRLQNAVEPDIDARAFKSLKKLRKNEDRAGIVVADTRGLADDLAHEIAEDSDVVFLPTGTSGDDLRPTLALARKLAKHGAEGRLVVILSKVGRSEPQVLRRPSRRSRRRGSNCCRALAAARRLPERPRFRPRRARGAQRAVCARPPSAWRRPCSPASRARKPR